MTTKEEVFNNYEIKKNLGEGGFGKALLAKSKLDGSLVVIKVVNLENLDEEIEKKAINEGNIMRKLKKKDQHENIGSKIL